MTEFDDLVRRVGGWVGGWVGGKSAAKDLNFIYQKAHNNEATFKQKAWHSGYRATQIEAFIQIKRLSKNH